MARRKKDPLRVLSDEERRSLIQLRRAANAPAGQVARAIMILAVADGEGYQSAARAAGRKIGDAVSHIVSTFNREGLAALEPRNADGRVSRYDDAAKKRLLQVVRRSPTPEADNTATWSLMSLRHALRFARDVLPRVLTFTILHVLREAGFTFQRSRNWCSTMRSCADSGAAAKRRCQMQNIRTLILSLWITWAESVQRILKRRALDRQQPETPDEVIALLNHVANHENLSPTPFVRGTRFSAGELTNIVTRLAAFARPPTKPIISSTPETVVPVR